MSKLKIEGNHTLSGTIKISGAKNSAVALLPASILSNKKSKIYNIPKIRDIEYLLKILETLNCTYKLNENFIEINSSDIKNNSISEELSKQMRASYYFMGALLAKFKYVEISFPGGCNIGSRPIDLHIEGFKKLGASVKIEKNKYIISAKELKGTKIKLNFPSVGATINLILAATGAKGITTIENAAKEPEIINVIEFLKSMGCNITGEGTNVIKVEGKKDLDNGITTVYQDRIEASTYIILGSLIGKNLKINGLVKEHVSALLKALDEVGVKYKLTEEGIITNKCEHIKNINITTGIYPEFPTDVQQPFTVLLTQAEGISMIKETIYESRFKSANLLNKMGASTLTNGNLLKIKGKTSLHSSELYVPDLRGGAALLIAALIAEGTTILDNTSLILRGYEDIVEKLTNVGAKIQMI